MSGHSWRVGGVCGESLMWLGDMCGFESYAGLGSLVQLSVGLVSDV